MASTCSEIIDLMSAANDDLSALALALDDACSLVRMLHRVPTSKTTWFSRG
jgi:hypothetical protein